jgi:cell division septation protein DedD
VPRNEDGEFELILGNRQLLSVFFIGVVLLGVFFTMGYIVGRNSGPVTAPDVAARKSDSKPLVVDAPNRDAAAPAPSSVAEPPSASPVETAPQQPASSEDAKPPKHEPAESAPAAAEKPSPAAAADQPIAGLTYLQLAATSEREAEILVDILRKKGFRALATVKPDSPGTYRVLVGPVSDGGLNQLRADLQGSGFPGNAAIKRTF